MKKLNLILIAIIILFVGCSPQSKETYLDDYQDFMTEIKKNHKSFSEKDWRKYDEEFNKYSKEWFANFKDDLTWKERIVVEKYTYEYKLYSVKRFVNTLLNNKDVNEIKQQIKRYKEEGAEKDLEFLLKQAQQAGEETEKVIKDIFEELEIDVR